MRSTTIQLGVALTIFLIIGAASVFWHYELKRIRADATARVEEIAKLESLRTGAHYAKTESAGLFADEEAVTPHLVEEEDIVSFLERVESLGRQFGATVAVASVSDTVEAGTITVSLSISGTFDAVMRTLGALEYGSQAVVAKTLTLDTREGDTWTAVGTFLVATSKDTP